MRRTLNAYLQDQTIRGGANIDRGSILATVRHLIHYACIFKRVKFEGRTSRNSDPFRISRNVSEMNGN